MVVAKIIKQITWNKVYKKVFSTIFIFLISIREAGRKFN